MLRCPPSQIHLTAADTQGLDQRINARHRANREIHRADARLSYAPRLNTTLSIVSTGSREQGCRTVSTGSEATICTDDGISHDPPVSYKHLASSTKLTQSCSVLTSAVASNAVHHPTDTAKARLRRSSHSDQPSYVQYLHGHRYEASHRRRKTSPSGHAIFAFDGAAEDPTGCQASASQASSIREYHQAGRTVLRELPSDSGALALPSSERRAVLNARDQPRNPGNYGEHFPLYEDTAHSQEAAHMRHPSHRLGHLDASQNLLLNPDAPIFTPRLRFGSTVTISDTDSNGETQSQRVADALRLAHAAVDLRIRSSSEQNVDPSQRQRPRSNAITATPASRSTQQLSPSLRLLPPDRETRLQQHRASETGTLPLPSPNLERYPILATGRPRSSSGRSEASSSHRNAGERRSPEENPGVFAPAPQTSDAGLLRPLSPTLSTSSRSTPNLFPRLSTAPAVHDRSSSLSCSQDDNKANNTQRQPSMVSAASGISDIRASISEESSSTRQTPSGALDAASEFLRFRSSPLDDLTAELSRLSTALGPRQYDGAADETCLSSGRSVRLLNGDPFCHTNEPSLERRSQTPREVDHVTELDRTATDVTGHTSAIRLRHSPSQPTSVHVPAKPATPIPIQLAPTPLATRSPPKPNQEPPTTTRTPRTQPHRTTNTPHMAIYNDSTPARLQPQTPLDLPRSSRRARNRSDTAIHQPSITVSRAFVPSPPAIPERRVYRNTYPSAISTGGVVALGSAASASVLHGSGADAARRRRTRENQRSGGEDGENDVEGMAAELEEDRSLWYGRRGVEGLEITPPREGRFERFLG